jgi:hypothetical protein
MKFVPPSPELVAEIRALAERRLTAEEFDRYVHAPWSDDDRDEAEALLRWFSTRYKTPAERLAAARRSTRRARRMLPPTR